MFLKFARTLATTTAPKMSRILRFDGLPYKVSPTQLQDWITDLSEINPSKVHLISNRQGLASGDAYVTFDEKSMAKTVIENCDEKNIGDSNRYVRIYEAEEEELEAAAEKEQQEDSKNTTGGNSEQYFQNFKPSF